MGLLDCCLLWRGDVIFQLTMSMLASDNISNKTASTLTNSDRHRELLVLCHHFQPPPSDMHLSVSRYTFVYLNKNSKYGDEYAGILYQYKYFKYFEALPKDMRFYIHRGLMHKNIQMRVWAAT